MRIFCGFHLLRLTLICGVILLLGGPSRGEPVAVRRTEGLLRGFLTLRDLDGTLLATGDLTQIAAGGVVTNELVFHFKDGSLHQETSVFSQRRVFRLLTYHLVQKGPSFQRATDLSLNHSTGQVSIRYTDDDGKTKVVNESMKLPEDVANGLVTTLLTHIAPGLPKATLSMVASTPKPRLVKLAISPEGEDHFSIAGSPRKAVRYRIKVEIGGIAGVVAPVVGKQPPDTHFWLTAGKAPGFLKSEGPLCDGGPVWRIELASPVWSKNDSERNP